jgi:hypothetical protein
MTWQDHNLHNFSALPTAWATLSLINGRQDLDPLPSPRGTSRPHTLLISNPSNKTINELPVTKLRLYFNYYPNECRAGNLYSNVSCIIDYQD